MKRISYIEDEPDIRTIAAFSLTELGGFTVQLCESGPEALDKTPAFKPDLILLDVMMPVMDGIETFKRLKQVPGLARTPIAFMTAKIMKGEVQRYLSMGAVDVIAKPFDPLTLPDQLREIWDRVQQAEAAGGSHAGKQRSQAG